MHERLKKRIQEASRKAKDSKPDLDVLYKLLERDYRNFDKERDKAADSIQKFSENLADLSREFQHGNDKKLQAILDNVKDSILMVAEDGRVLSSNPMTERIFGYSESEIENLTLDEIVPVTGEKDLPEFLENQASMIEDTIIDQLTHEVEGLRYDGTTFCAEIAISSATLDKETVYVVCLRDITERKVAHEAISVSEARYRTMVDYAPEAIVLIDHKRGKFVDMNENAVRLFKMDKEELLSVGVEKVSPPVQPDGSPSTQLARDYIEQTLDGESPVFEWMHRDGDGNDIPCEIRLVCLPSKNNELIRGSITDISQRKRRETLATGEKRVLERIASNATIDEVMRVVAETVEDVSRGTLCTVMLLDDQQEQLKVVAAPSLHEDFVEAVDRVRVEASNGPFGKAVHLGRPVIIVDLEHDALWDDYREIAKRFRLHSCWASPIISGEGDILGTFVNYYRHTGNPRAEDFELLGRMAQLAAIAVERQNAEEKIRNSENRFRGLFDNVVDGVYQCGVDGRIISANPALVRMLGFDSEEELKALDDIAELYINPLDREVAIRKIKDDGRLRNFEYRMRRKDDHEVFVMENTRAVYDENGDIVNYEGTISDITDRKLAEMAVFEAKEKAQVTLQSIGDAVITTDSDGKIDYMNPVAEDLTGWATREVRGELIEKAFQIVDRQTRAPVDNPVTRCLREGHVVGLAADSVLISRSDKEHSIQDSAAPIRDRMGHIIGAVMVFHDISQEQVLRRALSYQASHDSLTGLINRREFENRVSETLEILRHDPSRTGVLVYIDVDQFKVINDTWGHTAGDELLKQLTDLAKTQIRTSDLLARLGGDEFGVLLEDCGIETALSIAEELRQAVRKYRFEWQGDAMNLSVSIGLVGLTSETEGVDEVMSAADVACYSAKDMGRNRVRVYQEGDDAPERHKEIKWVSRITRACEEDRLELWYQSIVPIGPNPDSRGHYELLLRMRDEDGEIVMPDRFIPAAERYNLMPTIDRWVVQRALSSIAKDIRDKSGGEPFMLAINLSGTSLNDDRFLDYVIDQFKGHRLASCTICFEITETAAISHLNDAASFMHKLSKYGCKFSLDDFGSGLSSFTYLKNLPVDFLKIDGHFIKNVTRDHVDQCMVDAIAKVGEAMGIQCIAERVETQDVLAKLAEIGIQYAQGYYISKPRPIEQFKRTGNDRFRGKGGVQLA